VAKLNPKTIAAIEALSVRAQVHRIKDEKLDELMEHRHDDTFFSADCMALTPQIMELRLFGETKVATDEA
jgi:hypothetical protein